MWTDLDLTDNLAKLFYRVSRNPSDLSAIASLVSNATLDDSYQPSLAVIVTWENVSMHGTSMPSVSMGIIKCFHEGISNHII